MGAKGSRTKQQKFNLATSTIPDTEPVYGFENALFHCTSFREAIISHHTKEKQQGTLLWELGALFSSIAHKKKRTSVAMAAHVDVCVGFSLVQTHNDSKTKQLRKANEVFDSSMQQDAQEFLNFMLSDICETLEKSCSAGDSGKKAAKVVTSSWIQNIFEGKLSNETRCLCCETVLCYHTSLTLIPSILLFLSDLKPYDITTRDEAFLNLSIEIKQNSSVTSCLRSFCATETLRGESKFFCDKCNTYQEAQKSIRLKALPKVLVLHLKRFMYVEKLQRLNKLSYRVVFPFELRLFDTTNDAEDPTRLYTLSAIVVHLGSQINRGHYISLVKSHQEWLLFDDDVVEVVSETFIETLFGRTDEELKVKKSSDSAYILFYTAA